MTIGAYAIGASPIGGTNLTTAVAVRRPPFYFVMDDDGTSLFVDSEGNVIRDFYWAVGSRAVPISGVLVDTNGEPIPLTGCTVKLNAKNLATGVLDINDAASVVSEADAQVSYTPTAADVTAPAEYIAQWEITDGSSLKQYVPTPGAIRLHVVDSVS